MSVTITNIWRLNWGNRKRFHLSINGKKNQEFLLTKALVKKHLLTVLK